MFQTVKRIIRWCGEFRGKLYLGFVFSFFSTWFAAMPIMAAAYTVGLLIQGRLERKWIGLSLLVIGALVLLRFLFSYLQARFQEAISYELVARDRLAIGEALKRVSLGYFQQVDTGNILNSITTGLHTLENMGIRMVDSFIGGYLNFLCILLCLLAVSPLATLISPGGDSPVSAVSAAGVPPQRGQRPGIRPGGAGPDGGNAGVCPGPASGEVLRPGWGLHVGHAHGHPGQ